MFYYLKKKNIWSLLCGDFLSDCELLSKQSMTVRWETFSSGM